MSNFNFSAINVYNETKSPHFKWLDHTLAVTDIFIGALGSHVFTASLDKTCKVSLKKLLFFLI